MTAMVDVERLLSGWLRTRTEITDVVGQRVFTDMPARAEFPLIRITQIGGAPVYSRPMFLDESVLQLDFYGGPKAQARLLFDTTRDLMARYFAGAHDAGVVTSVLFGEASYIPDDIYDPPKPRWIAETSIFTHP